MTITIRERGGKFYADGIQGGSLKTRIRGALGTRNREAANTLVSKLEVALVEGSQSRLWPELRTVLPLGTFQRFTNHVGYKEQVAEPPATWALLKSEYEALIEKRVTMRKARPCSSSKTGLEESSAKEYRFVLREFDIFLAEENKKPDVKIELVEDIEEPVFDRYDLWRLKRIAAHKWSRGGRRIILEHRILRAVFAFAVKKGMVAKNPVKVEEDPGENGTSGAQPYSSTELSKLRVSAGNALFFPLLLWTGFRRSDAVRLLWDEIDFEREEIRHVLWKTRRFGKSVLLPINSELLSALRAERDRRNPRPTDPVLFNSRTGKPMTAQCLYLTIVSLGKRAGVPNAYTHRFRDTFACYLLGRGASTYYVAKLLGNTEKIIEKHYAHFVQELRDRLRTFVES